MVSFGNIRWAAKKVGRLGLASAGSLLGTPNLFKPRVHVLTYHRFGTATRDAFCVPRQTFARQMHWLAAQNLAISLVDVQTWAMGTSTVRDGAVLVTIDDACSSVLTDALPILRDFAIPAVVYAPAALVGRPSTNEFGERVLRWDELESLQKDGIVIGSHGLYHQSLGRISLDVARQEAFDSRALLSSRLGAPVTTFAYPFGTRGHHNDNTRAILRDAGYETGFTSHHGAIRAGLDPLALPRVKVECGDFDWMFRRICMGAMNGWAVVDAM